MNATITDYAGLRLAIKARRMALGLSTLALDELAGLQSGYSTKLENGIKNFGTMSLDAVLGALGLSIELTARKLPKDQAKSDASLALSVFMSKKAAKGGRATARSLTQKQLRARARKAGLASGVARKKRARLDKVAKRERDRGTVRGKADV